MSRKNRFMLKSAAVPGTAFTPTLSAALDSQRLVLRRAGECGLGFGVEDVHFEPAAYRGVVLAGTRIGALG
jgi:hypothetical protein